MNPLAFPHLDQYVNDFSEVIPEEQRLELNEIFAKHENNTTEQVVVVLFPHREGNELLDIGLKIFNENGIGQKNLNNGLLLIIATEEKKIRIITGKGMELKYPEMRCRTIIENHLRPLLNEGKYEELIGRFFETIHDTHSPVEQEVKQKPIFFPDPDNGVIFEIPKNSRAEGVAMIGSLIVILLLIVFFVRSCSQADWSSSSGGSYQTSSDSDWGSDSSSSDWGGSSYDGGGGSSNGGGWGD